MQEQSQKHRTPRLRLLTAPQARLLGGISSALLPALLAWQEAAGGRKMFLVRQAPCLLKAKAAAPPKRLRFAAQLPRQTLQAWIALVQWSAGKQQAAGGWFEQGCAAEKQAALPRAAAQERQVAAGAGLAAEAGQAALAFCQTMMRIGIFSAAGAGFGLRVVLQLRGRAGAWG